MLGGTSFGILEIILLEERFIRVENSYNYFKEVI